MVEKYYAAPLVVYTNTPSKIVIQLPIFLKKRNAQPFSLYNIETIPVLADRDTYASLANDHSTYTHIKADYPYIAASPMKFIPYTKPRLCICTKLLNMYLCETLELYCDVTGARTCISSLLYGESGKIVAATCNVTYLMNVKPEPKILDGVDSFVLSAIPPPWIIQC